MTSNSEIKMRCRVIQSYLDTLDSPDLTEDQKCALIRVKAQLGHLCTLADKLEDILS